MTSDRYEPRRERADAMDVSSSSRRRSDDRATIGQRSGAQRPNGSTKPIPIPHFPPPRF